MSNEFIPPTKEQIYRSTPAFPYILTDEQNSKDTDFQPGLTKREYFAGLAMQGIMANGGHEFGVTHKQIIAEIAIAHADELLKQLSNE